eukprot:1962154-Pyramimonas_sp.AAC.1
MARARADYAAWKALQAGPPTKRAKTKSAALFPEARTSDVDVEMPPATEKNVKRPSDVAMTVPSKAVKVESSPKTGITAAARGAKT